MKTPKVILATGIIAAAVSVSALLYGQSPASAQPNEPPGNSATATASPGKSPSQPRQGDPFVKDQPNKPLAAAPSAQASKPVCNLQMVVEIYALGQTDAAELMETDDSGEARRNRVLELVKAGKARFESLMSNVSKSGIRSTVEQVDEFRYPTKFDPSKTVGDPAFPTEFETRNVGEILEYEPVLSPDHRLCDLNNVLTLVRFDGFHEYRARPQDAPVAQPIFESSKITTAERVSVGSYRFLGTLNHPFKSAEATRKPGDSLDARLVFARIDVAEVPVAPAAKEARTSGSEQELNVQYSVFSLDREKAREILSSGAKAGGYYATVSALAEKSGDAVALLEKGMGDYAPEAALVDPAQTRLRFVGVLKKLKSEQRGAIEMTKEFRYITKYKLVSDGTNSTPRSSSESAPSFNLGHTTGYPAGVETRGMGFIFETEAALTLNGAVEINVVSQIVKNFGNLPSNGIAKSYPPQPWFRTQKITTELSAPLGEQAFIGAFSPPHDDGLEVSKDTGRVLFTFVKTTLANP